MIKKSLILSFGLLMLSASSLLYAPCPCMLRRRSVRRHHNVRKAVAACASCKNGVCPLIKKGTKNPAKHAKHVRKVRHARACASCSNGVCHLVKKGAKKPVKHARKAKHANACASCSNGVCHLVKKGARKPVQAKITHKRYVRPVCHSCQGGFCSR